MKIIKLPLFLLTIAASAFGQTPSRTEAPADIPVGEKFRYLTVDEVQMTRQDIAQEVTSSPEPGLVWMLLRNVDSDFHIWRLLDLREQRFTKSRAYDTSKPDMQGAERVAPPVASSKIQFPLFAGKKYPIRENWDNNKGENRFNGAVEKMEEVEVPAGKFKAWKISFSGPRIEFGSNEVQGESKGALWYAPEVKRTVKSEVTHYNYHGQAFKHQIITLLEWTPAAAPTAQK